MRNLFKLIYSVLPLGLQVGIRRLHYLRLVIMSTVKQEPELEILSQFLREGGVAIDVGANIGIYSKHLSRLVGDTGQVFSLEPFKDSFSQLCFNIKLLGIRNVKTFNVAASSIAGESQLKVPLASSGLPNIYRASLMAQTSKDIQYVINSVKTIPLDSLLDSVSSVNFIKIDVEGHEFDVLAGAKEIICKYKPVLLVEVSGISRELSKEGQAVISYLRGLGYLPFYASADGLSEWVRPVGGENLFFFHSSGLPKSVR